MKPVYQSLDEVITEYGGAMVDETAAAFRQGAIIAHAIDSGFKAREVVKACASHVRRKSRTVYNRLKVYRAFGDDWNPQVDWTTHLIAAGTENPREWLERAVDENMSSRQLENAIGNRPTVYLKNVLATVCQVHHDKRSATGFHVIELAIEGGASEDYPAVDQIVLVTLQAPAQEAQAA
jgi:hypothetical protein